MDWDRIAAGGWPENEEFARLSLDAQLSELHAAALLAAEHQAAAPEMAHRIASAALHLLDTNRLTDSGLRATFGALLGVASAILGRNEEAELQYRQVIEGPRSPGMARQRAQALAMLGALLHKTRPQDAFAVLQAAIAEATELRELRMVANASISLASLQNHFGDVDGARRTYQHAIDLFANASSHGDRQDASAILGRLHGNVANLLGGDAASIDEAIIHYVQAVGFFDNAGEASNAARRSFQLVGAVLEAGQFARGLRLFKESRRRIAHAPDACASTIQELGWFRAPDADKPAWEAEFAGLADVSAADPESTFHASLIGALILLRGLRHDTPGVLALADDARTERLPESSLRDGVTACVLEVCEQTGRRGPCWHLRWRMAEVDDDTRLAFKAAWIKERACLWVAEQIRRIPTDRADMALHVDPAVTAPPIVGIASVPVIPPDWLGLVDPIERTTFAELRGALCAPEEAVRSEFFELYSSATDARGNPRPGSVDKLQRALTLSNWLASPDLQVSARSLLAKALAEQEGGATKNTFPVCRQLLDHALVLAEGLPAEQIRVYITRSTIWKEAQLGDEAGRLDESISELKRARSMAQPGGSPGVVAEIAVNLGNALSAYPVPTEQQLEEARECLGQGIAALSAEPDEALKGVLHNSLGQVYFRLAEFDHRRSRLESALQHLQEALLLRERDGDAGPLLVTLGNLLGATVTARDSGLPRPDSEIAALVSRIREVVKSCRNRRAASTALLNAAVVLRRASPDQALTLGLEALAAARKDGVTRTLVDACRTVGRVYRHLGDYHQAIRTFEEGVLALEGFRGEGGDSTYRAGLAKYYRSLYEDLIGSREAAGVPPSELWWTVERSAGRTLIENMRMPDAAPGCEDVVVKQLIGSLPSNCLVVQIYRLEDEVHWLALRVVDGRLDIRPCRIHVRVTASDVRDSSEADGARLHDRAYTPEAPQEFHLQLAWLRAQVLEPLLRENDFSSVTRVVIAAQGLDASYAWHAAPLPDNSGTLGDRFDVVQIPNVSLLAQLIARPHRPIQKAVFVACDPHRTLTQHIEETLHAFSSLHCRDKIVLSDTSRAISADAVLSACREADLVHFSGHSALISGNPEQSGLLLSDGILTIPRLERGLASQVPALVVLSSCESAAEDVYFGDVPTLSTAFLQAGVTCVVGAAWPVPDDVAAATMRGFYELMATNGPITSLCGARRRLVSREGQGYEHSFKIMGWA